MNRLVFVLFFASLCACNNNNADNTAPAARTEAATTPNIPVEEKKLRDEVARYPDSLLLKENLIEYFKKNGSYEQAIAATEQFLQKDSLNPRLLYINAFLQSENEDTVKAIHAWEKVVSIDPQPENVMSLGSLYALTKNAGALDMADALLMVKKEDMRVQAFFIKGLYYSSTGEKVKAMGFFDQCLQLNYRYLFAYREKAICQYDLGKYLDAIKTLELSIAIQRTNEEAYYWLGRCFEKLGKKETATQNYELALQFDPEYIEAKDALGKMGVVR